MRLTSRSVGAGTMLAIAAAGTLAAPAGAKIIPTRSALTLARAIASDPKTVVGAKFSIIPPDGVPTAVSTTPLGGFPTAGKSFAILSTGDARYADNKNTSGHLGRADNGLAFRGARDATILRVRVRVPPSKNCLSVRFRFLTEEYPEFVGSDFNDAFLIERYGTGWSAGDATNDPHITSTLNFAQDTQGNIISVNAAGDSTVTAGRAKGTTYDGATRRLRASTPINSGRHFIFFSIFDQGDRAYDSAVFIDRMTLERKDAADCKSGAAKDPDSSS